MTTIVFPLLEELPECPVCCYRELRPLDVYGIGRPIAVDACRLALVGCEACGIVFSHPLPTEEALARYYVTEDEDWDRRVRQRLDRKTRREPGRENEAGDACDHGPVGGESGAGDAPAVEGKGKLTKRARHREELASLAAWLPNGEGRRALDFGCGIGVFLDVLKESGWETYGLEPGPTARAYVAQRHKLVDEIRPDLDVDLAVVYHVLEHLRDPLGTLRRVAAAVRPEGYLLVAVPDFGRLPEHRDRTYVASKLHIFSFTRSSLRSLLGLVGFEVLGFPEPTDGRARRLLCLARRTDAVRPLDDEPLAEALVALRRYGGIRASELDDQAAPAKAGRSIPRRLRIAARRLLALRPTPDAD